jgi:hypothetical protein
VALPLLLLMALYRRRRGRDGLGLGDVKLAAVCGAWLDLTPVAAVIELAALLAIGAYATNAALRRERLRGTAFLPFGLFLAVGWANLVCELARRLARLRQAAFTSHRRVARGGDRHNIRDCRSAKANGGEPEGACQ